jgi:protoporphyrinogen oxidase
VSTVALPTFLDLLQDELPEEVSEARRRLRWVRVLNLALGVRGAPPRPEHWLYYPDPELPFYRVGLPSNHGNMAPTGCHTVSVEVSLEPDGGDVEGAAADAQRALEAVGLLDPDHIAVRLVTILDPAYVVYDLARQHALATIESFLDSHGVMVAGRWAEWKYSAMEDAILDGMAVARRLGEDGRG